MPDREPEQAREDDDAGEGEDRRRRGPRAMWTGSLSFGLVSVPIELHVAARSTAPRLRMMAADGTPLQRRYRCPAHDRLLDDDEIVRGYPIEQIPGEPADEGDHDHDHGPDHDHGFVVVEDAELDALAPERSQELALVQFAPHEQLPLAAIDRTYYLTPRSDNTRGYRLLAEVMERTGLAGIGTFVMRGHAHLAAIVAEHGLLRAELLRFAEELRTPDEAGLPRPPGRVEPLRLEAMHHALDELYSEELELEALHDDRAERLQQLAQDELARGQPVIETGDEEEDLRLEVVDLMQAIKDRLGSTPAAASG